jgi:hypothetical protein
VCHDNTLSAAIPRLIKSMTLWYAGHNLAGRNKTFVWQAFGVPRWIILKVSEEVGFSDVD